MADVFISYSAGKASEVVEEIVENLNRAQISCWYMDRDSKYGDFAEIIEREIHSCSVFLLILDNRSNQSEHVKNEVALAFDHITKLTLLPVCIDDSDISPSIRYYIKRFTRMNANPPNTQRIQELTGTIANILKKEEFSQELELSSKIIKMGYCGDSTYTLDGRGSLMIFGNEIQNYQWDRKANAVDTPWWDERETISFVDIQNGISVIGSNAFRDCPNLTEVIIPPSVTSVGDAVFFQCASLANAEIPQFVGYIGDYAFSDCGKLSFVNIPEGVTYIGDGAFQRCKNLSEINIPQSVTDIGDYAFSYCENLNPVIIPYKVKYIGKSAFRGCTSLTSIFIPDSVDIIESYAFEGCTKLHSASIPANVKYYDIWSGFPSFPYNTRITRRE